MASEALVAELKMLIQDTLNYKAKGLESSIRDMLRHGPEKNPRLHVSWMYMKFDEIKDDIDRNFLILNRLNELPLKNISNNSANEIKNEINTMQQILSAINNYHEQNNSIRVRDSLVAQLRQNSDSFYELTARWIPFLAYQRGDINHKMEELSKAATEAKETLEKTLEEAKISFETKIEEIDLIITKAREASASIGAAAFAKDFDNAAAKIEGEAKGWLKAAVVLALVTLVSVALSFTLLYGSELLEAIQILGNKIAILVVLFTITLWCGRNYKALRHQAANHRHRALALQTFQAFSVATADETTKNAVLLETTRSIFANTASGFIEGRGNENPSQIVEVFKASMGKGSGDGA